MAELADRLRGDGPCDDCGTLNNIVWFAESVLWNEVMSGPEPGNDPGGIICIPCFIIRVDKAGLAPTGWRLIPDWHWETRAERSQRSAFADPHPECQGEFHGADGGACAECGWDPFSIIACGEQKAGE